MTLPRRTFLASTAAALALPSLRADTGFVSAWESLPDRPWIGPDFWANPLQDWRVAGGRVECVKAGRGRTLHWLTRDLSARPGTLRLRLRVGSLDAATVAGGQGGAGFSLGVRGPLEDFRNRLIYGTGFTLGLRATGQLFIGDGKGGATAPVDLAVPAVDLRVEVDPQGEAYRVTLRALDARDGRVLGEVTSDKVPAEFLTGNLALAANFGAHAGKPGPNAPATGRWWFSHAAAEGSKLDTHPDRAFGPVVFTQYTLHAGVLKLTAQLLPVASTEPQDVFLQARDGQAWTTLSTARLDPLARTATFRVENWDDRADRPVRALYRDAGGGEHAWEGRVRADPATRDVLTVADISCNAHYAFPNSEAAAGVAKLDPDLVAFTGDQYYEPSGGFGVDASSVENACLDVLRKWCLHAWTWRDLIRDRPSVSLPDDHDVYHGNLWGEGGVAAPANSSGAEAKGGYKMMAGFVNAVHRMQTAHHPDSPGKPGAQGVTAYYGPLTYGGVSFALLADRQYKSGPDGKVPPTTTGRADHVNDPAFDPKTADLPGLELLGEPQMNFLREWTRDWKHAEMKAVISQTLFTAMATHHGGKNQRLVADYDTNAWPQAARNAALREMRKSFAFHLAGDQHLPAVVHYGVDGPRDAGVAFASPAINNLYHRWFSPEGAPGPIGDFRDSFGHPLGVLACANPKYLVRPGVLEAEMDKSAGYGVVRFDKRNRSIVVECWPLLADPTRPGTQFPGWPVKVRQLDNAGRGAALQLPLITVKGIEKPLFEITNAATGELVYAYRASGPVWQPHAPAEGSYTVKVSNPETGAGGGMGATEAKAVNEGRMEIHVAP